MDSKQAMMEAFGADTGRKLYTVATKLADRYGIDLEDVASEVMLTALDCQTRYGFVHITTVGQRVKNELYDTYKYGVNRYYGDQYGEISADAETEDGGTVLDTLAAPDTYRAVDVKLVVEQVVAGLSERDREIVRGLYELGSVKAVAEKLDAKLDTIYKRRAFLAWQFKTALA